METQFAITIGEFTTGTTEHAGTILIDNSHFEVTEGFIEFDDKSLGLENGILNLTNNRFNFKCQPTGPVGSEECEQTFLDAHFKYMTLVQGNHFRSNYAGTVTAVVDVDDGTRDGVGGVWCGHNTRRELGASTLVFDVGSTRGRIVKIDADKTEGLLYNDLDFDETRDAGEY